LAMNSKVKASCRKS